MFTSCMSYIMQIAELSSENRDFRRILHTGMKSQLSIMSIPPADQIGHERHPGVEQTLFVRSGLGEAVLEGQSFLFGPGDVLVISPGTLHAIRNIGNEELKIIAVCSPANHLQGRVHHTHSEAVADIEDETYQWELEGVAVA